MDDNNLERLENENTAGGGQPGNAPEKMPFSYELYSILQDFAYILAAITILFVFLFRLVGVDGSSMYPTLNDRDFMVLKSNFLDSQYEQGDIVVLTIPDVLDGKPIVKRVIATEGMTVDINFAEGVVYVDGTPLEEPYTYEPTYLNYAEGIQYPATVPEGCVFVMGDNRNNSTDSRYRPVGMVNTKYVMGTVMGIVLPGRATDAYNQIIGGRDFKRIGSVR